jgi:hypothetical protein
MSKQAQFPIFGHPGVIISLILSCQTSNFCKIENSKKNSITVQLEKVLCNFCFQIFHVAPKVAINYKRILSNLATRQIEN